MQESSPDAPGLIEAGTCTHDKDLSADLSVISGSVRIQKSLVGRASLSAHVIGLRITGRGVATRYSTSG